MCGIAGYLGRFEAEELDTMSLRVAQRGPDGDGVWISDNRQVGLAHRRLSIIDLSSNASQPMIEDDVHHNDVGARPLERGHIEESGRHGHIELFVMHQ